MSYSSHKEIEKLLCDFGEDPDVRYHRPLLELFQIFTQRHDETVTQEALEEWETRQIAEALEDVRDARKRKQRNYKRALSRGKARARRRSAASVAMTNAESLTAAVVFDDASAGAVKQLAAGQIWDILTNIVKGS